MLCSVVSNPYIQMHTMMTNKKPYLFIYFGSVETGREETNKKKLILKWKEQKRKFCFSSVFFFQFFFFGFDGDERMLDG